MLEQVTDVMVQLLPVSELLEPSTGVFARERPSVLPLEPSLFLLLLPVAPDSKFLAILVAHGK
jgi:hypothetical protein